MVISDTNIKNNRKLINILVTIIVLLNIFIYLFLQSKIIFWLLIILVGYLFIINNSIMLFDIVIILMPIMFYMYIPFTINISVADFLMPPLIYYHLLKKKTNFKQKKILDIMIRYGIIMCWIMAISIINLINLESSSILKAIVAISKILICLSYGVITINHIIENGRERFLKISFYSSLIFCLVLIIGVIAYNSGVDLGLTYDFRATGTYEDPNLASAHLFLVCAFGIAYCINKNKKIITILYINLIFICILLTSSKGALVAIVSSIIMLFIINIIIGNIKVTIRIISIISITLTILFSIYLSFPMSKEILNPIKDRITNFTQDVSTDRGFQERENLWSIAFELGSEKPILGIGVEQFIPAAREIKKENIHNIPHNTYLTFFAETGIIGLISFLWLPLLIFIKILTKIKKNKLYNIYLFSFISILISMFSINLQNFRVLWVFIAYMVYEIWYVDDNKNTLSKPSNFESNRV